MVKKLLMKIGLLLILVTSFLPACEEVAQSEVNVLPLTLVRRSVLDQKIRMLTLRFGNDHFAAYDLENARLEKIWQGGVLWNGAVFNNMKTVQPESFGEVYWHSDDQDSSWKIDSTGEKKPVKPAYQGYILKNNRLSLNYIIKDPAGKEIKVVEQVRFLEVSGKPVYKRVFSVSGMPEGENLYFGNRNLNEQPETSLTINLDPLAGQAIPKSGISDNSSQYWLERSGCNTCHDISDQRIGPSYQAIAGNYTANNETIALLSGRVKKGSSGSWGQVAMIPHPDLDETDIKRMVRYILSLRPETQDEVRVKPVSAKVELDPEIEIPGFGYPLNSVHPGYDLIPIRPSWFKPRVGGMAFLPDGRLLISTWDSIGAVYALEGLETNDTSKVTVKQIAGGLSEPLGLTTVGEDIFVMQKHELTQLIDHDKDGIVDEYRSINHSFGATPDFHEFSYGLVYQDGYFYGSLGLAMRLMSHEIQDPDRGTAFKIGMDGSFKILARGLRQPNGIGIGPEGELFVTENQGQWVPACKIIHIQKGKFYGCHFGTGDRYKDRKAQPPAVWLPQDEIGNSPSQPLLMQDGPYRGQMIYGEVTHGGIKRAFLEKVNGQYQGCVFRFSQGLEAGINRMAWGPDGALYVGGVGMNGNWAHRGNQYGLQKLVYNGKVPFELLAVRALPDGFELEFTQPVSQNETDLRKKIKVQQWYYKATPAYGGPKLDLQDLAVSSVSNSADGKKLSLVIPGLKKGYVVYFHLDPNLASEKEEYLWSGDAWYTLNNIPMLQ